MFSYEFSEIQEQIRDTAQRFALEEIAPTVAERDIKAEFPAEIIKKLGELGFMGFMVSEKWGGSGLDTVSYVIAQEEFCKVDGSIGIIFSVHNSLVNFILETWGTDQQKERLLKPLAMGDKIGVYCLSEPEAGSDASHQKTTAVKKDEYWVIDGMKNWVSTGQNADTYILFAQTDHSKGHKGITCFAIEKGTEGFEPQKKEDKMGMRSSDTCSVALTGVKVPDENRIGDVGEGFRIAMESLNCGRIGIASQGIGIAQGAFDKALEYSKQRKAFGKVISEHQAIQFKLADMDMKIEAARALVLKAAYLKDQHRHFVKESAQAKLFAANTAMEVTREAVQILGGYGYTREYQVEKMMRDAKVIEIYEGTSEVQHIIIARELLRE